MNSFMMDIVLLGGWEETHARQALMNVPLTATLSMVVVTLPSVKDPLDALETRIVHCTLRQAVVVMTTIGGLTMHTKPTRRLSRMRMPIAGLRAAAQLDHVNSVEQKECAAVRVSTPIPMCVVDSVVVSGATITLAAFL